MSDALAAFAAMQRRLRTHRTIRDRKKNRPRLVRPSDYELLDWIPAATPLVGRKPMVSPTWLHPVAEAFENIADGGEEWVVVNVPRQHGKSTLVTHGLVWLLAMLPGIRVIFGTYSDRRAWRISHRLKGDPVAGTGLLATAGLSLTRDAADTWELTNGSSVIWAGMGGGITGEPGDLVIIDDTVRSRADAESEVGRDNRWEWFHDVVIPTVGDGGSCIVVETRWHLDDVSGRIRKDAEEDEGDGFPWRFVSLKALDELDRPLAPEVKSYRHLVAMRRLMGGEDGYSWQSLMQQNPQPRGSKLFTRPPRYETLPTDVPLRYAIGLDLAYTAKTKSDHCAYVVIATPPQGTPMYVVEAQAVQKRAEDFVGQDLATLAGRYPTATWRFYGYGPELLAGALVRRMGVPILVKSVASDKFVRALPASQSHNTSKILWPAKRGGVDPLAAFLRVITDWTGTAGRDDEVDAYVAAHDEADRPHTAPPAPEVPPAPESLPGLDIQKITGY